MAPRRLLWHILEIGGDEQIGFYFRRTFSVLIYTLCVYMYYMYTYVRINIIEGILSLGALFSHYM
jgi:hypothetical protein